MNKHSEQVVCTQDVMGKKVINADNENLGKVEEIVLEKLSGQVRYAVLSFGGFLGLGDKLYAMPWRSLNYNPEEDAFQVNISKDKLKAAEGFNKDNWPDFADKAYTQAIDDYYTF